MTTVGRSGPAASRARTRVAHLKQHVVDDARKSVPDAISYLGAPFDRLIDLTDAKIDEVFPIFQEEEGEDDGEDGQLSLKV